MRTHRTRRDDESGAIAIMAAVLAMAMLLATALAVDVGRAAYASRDQQGVTDRIALDAVGVVTQGPYATLGQVHAAVEDALEESWDRNPITGTTTNEAIGTIDLLAEDSPGVFTTLCSGPFAPSTPTSCVGDSEGRVWSDVAAIRVQTTSFVPFIFAVGDPGRDVIKYAFAQVREAAQLTVGSEVAGLNDGVLNELLETVLCSTYQVTTEFDVDSDGNQITGSSGTRIDGLPSCDLGISLVGYQGLAAVDVTLGQLVEDGTLGVGSPQELLAAELPLVDLLTVAANVMGADGSPSYLALNELIAEINSQLTVNVGDMIGIASGYEGAAANATLDVLQLLMGSVQLINGTNLLDVPSLDVTLPGLGDLTTQLSVIEAPRSEYGPVGISASTSQIDLDVETVLDASITNGITSLVDGLLGGLLSGLITVDTDPLVLPLSVDVAAARATLDSLACGTAADQSDTTATVTTVTEALGLSIGDGSQWIEISQVDIEVLPLLGSPITAGLSLQVRMPRVSLGGNASSTDDFTGPYQAGPEHTSGTLAALNTSGLEVRVQTSGTLSGLNSIATSVSTSLSATLGTVLPQIVNGLSSTVLDPLLAQLGLGVGNADTWVDLVDCDARQLMPLGF